MRSSLSKSDLFTIASWTSRRVKVCKFAIDCPLTAAGDRANAHESEVTGVNFTIQNGAIDGRLLGQTAVAKARLEAATARALAARARAVLGLVRLRPGQCDHRLRS